MNQPSVAEPTCLLFHSQDSLWAAEDIEAVFDQDPQRVCILQGPVAVKHATKNDEPMKELLENVESQLIAKILEQYYEDDESKVPVIGFIGSPPSCIPASHLADVEVVANDSSITYRLLAPPFAIFVRKDLQSSLAA